MNRVNFKNNKSNQLHHLTPYRKNTVVKTKVKNNYEAKIEEIIEKEDVYWERLRNAQFRQKPPTVKIDTLKKHETIKAKVITNFKPQAEIKVINKPSGYTDNYGFVVYHSHVRYKLENDTFAVSDSIGGCGMQQIYGWARNSSFENSKRLLQNYLEKKDNGVGLIICQLGQMYFNSVFEQALISCGFTESIIYANLQHGSDGDYKQKIYTFKSLQE